MLAGNASDLEVAVDTAEFLNQGAHAKQSWQNLTAVFDRSQGRDVRQLIADSLEREGVAVEREYAAADSTLAWMRGFWRFMALALALLGDGRRTAASPTDPNP